MKNVKAYLCGAMEAVPDGGIQWRDRITPKLRALGIEVLDPTKTEKTKTGYDVAECKEKLKGWKLSGHWDEYNETMRKIVSYDIQDVVRSTFLIVYYDEELHLNVEKLIDDYLKTTQAKEPKNILKGFLEYMYKNNYFRLPMGGTICEIWHAFTHHIPMYIVTPNSASNTNNWMLFTMGTGGKFFPNFAQVMDKIEKDYGNKIAKVEVERLAKEDEVKKEKTKNGNNKEEDKNDKKKK